MEDTTLNKQQSNAGDQGNFDYSKGEETIKNIVIPNSQYHAKWVKEEGYAIGYENVKLTKGYKTLEKALNQIGYGVEKDEDGEEILVKVGDTDFELIARIIKAINIIENENNKLEGVKENG